MMAEMPEIAADIGCTREELCAAVDAGADQADADRLNRAVWTLFERAMSTRLMHRRIDPLAARMIELEGEVERLREQLVAQAMFGTPAATIETGDPCTLAECPVGLFYHGDELCIKTEYGNNEGRIDAFIVSSGEFFWGHAPQTIASQRASIVTPAYVARTELEPDA